MSALRLMGPGAMGWFSPVYPVTKLPGGSKSGGEDRSVILTEAERAEFLVSARGGRLVAADGRPFDSGGQLAKFVMTDMGAFYAGVKRVWPGRGALHHSSFTRGPVAGAGLAAVADGRITCLVCDSGRYQPTPRMMAQVLEELARSSFVLPGLPVGFHVGRDLAWYDAESVRRHHGDLDRCERRPAPPGW